MLRRKGFRKWFLIAWACALAFGFGMEQGKAEAASIGCWRACMRGCRLGGSSCYSYSGGTCDCEYTCEDGEGGDQSCA